MSARPLDRALESLARRQHGVFHRRQALRIGFTAKMIRGRLATGAWIVIGGDVYGLPSHPGTWRRQCMAATLTVPAGAVWGRPAAALYEVPMFRPGPIEVVTRHGTTHGSPLAVVRESRTVGRFVVVDGIRVVSKEDCTIQVARHLSIERLRSMIGYLDRHDRRYLPALRDRHVALARSRLPGMRKLRFALGELADDDPPTDSDLEIALRSLVGSVAAIGPVTWQAPLPFWPRGRTRCDGLATRWPLILEADGRTWHTRVEDFERDRERDNLANVHGYDVLRFTYDKLTNHLGDCRRMLTAYVARRSGSTRPIWSSSTGSLVG
ncbi:MAG: hypothetical protein QOC92_3363 [Acidimicrobiaceae bacterium]